MTASAREHEETGFESAQFLLAGVESDIDELNTKFREFFARNPYTVVKEINRVTGQYHGKLVFEPIPSRLRYITSNCIKNLRDALDQACSAASDHVKGSRCRNAHFPFGESPDDLEVAFRKNTCKQIPPDLYPILRSFEPYPTGDGYTGGNNALRLLGRISGPHKHRITLATVPQLGNVTLGDIDMQAGKGGAILHHIFSEQRKDNEFPLVTIGPGGHAKFNLNFSCRVVFSNTKLRDIPVHNFISSCLSSIGKIIQDLETESFRIRS